MQRSLSPAAPGRLLRILGLGFGLAVGVGAVVGGEILRLPGPVAKAIPQPGLYLAAWTLGGAYAALCALSFAELGTRVPRSGGMTAFAEAGLGPFAGFLVGWGDFLASAFTVAAYALLVGDLAKASGLPGPTRGLAALAVLLVGGLQWPGLRAGSLLQDASSAAKGLLLLGLAALALGLAPAGPVAPAVPAAGGGIAFLGAMQLVLFAYDNYYAAVYFGDEYREPARQVPRALLGGVALVAALYLLLAWGLSRGLGHGVLAASDFPGAELGRRLGGPAGAKLVAAVFLLSLLSAMNATTLIASRIVYALGTEGLAGAPSTAVNRGGTPTTGLAATLALALAGLALPSFEQAVQFMSPLVLLNYGLCFAALLVLRRRQPSAAGVFRAPGFPATTLLSLLGSLVFLGGSLLAEPRLGTAALALVALALPLFRFLARRGLLRPGGRPAW